MKKEKPEKTADIIYPWFPREITSEKQVQKYHTYDASLSRSWQYFWLVEANFPRGSTNQKRYSDLGSDA